MTLLLKILRFNEMFATSCGILANLILIWLVLTVNKSNMKQITQTLIQNSLLDLLLALTILIVQPQIVIVDRIYFVIVGSPLSFLGFTFAGFANPFFGFSIVLSILAMPVPFYIRFTVLCRNSTVKLKHLFGIYLVLFCYSLSLFLGIIFLYPPHAETFEPYKHLLQTDFWLDEYKNGPIFVAMPLKDDHLLILFGVILFANCFSYSMVTFFAITIAKSLKQNKFKLSKRTMMLNKQLQKTLIVQTVIPFFIGNLPLGIVMALIFLKIESLPTTLIATAIFSWLTVVNPTAAIFIMRPYRTRIVEMLKFKMTRASNQYTASDPNNILATVTTFNPQRTATAES